MHAETLQRFILYDNIGFLYVKSYQRETHFITYIIAHSLGSSLADMNEFIPRGSLLYFFF
jgi:hypothetical protein